MDSPDMQRVSLYLPRKLVQEADRTKEKCGFSSRNEFYAKAVESFIAEQLLEDDVINSAYRQAGVGGTCAFRRQRQSNFKRTVPLRGAT